MVLIVILSLFTLEISSEVVITKTITDTATKKSTGPDVTVTVIPNTTNSMDTYNPTNLNSTTPSTHTPPIESLLDMTLRDVIEIFKDEISPLSLYSSSTSPPPSSPTSYYYSSTPSSSTLSLSSTLCGEEDYQKEDFRKESFNLPPSVSANDISL
ncbi:22409_t:CDS:2 [Entrophospora sp. SA101]|nr:22409_t:CDS:2 [Entrophospora sp. SA101]